MIGKVKITTTQYFFNNREFNTLGEAALHLKHEVPTATSGLLYIGAEDIKGVRRTLTHKEATDVEALLQGRLV